MIPMRVYGCTARMKQGMICMQFFLLIFADLTLGDTWDCLTHTADEQDAGTDSDTWIEIHGTYGQSSWLWLEGSQERDYYDYSLYFLDIGEPYMVKIAHESQGWWEIGSGWLLDFVELYNRDTGKTYRFNCWCWLDDSTETIYGETRVCKDIAHCVPGMKGCGYTIYDNECYQCEEPYYSGGYNGGCHECTYISRCLDRYCTNGYDQKCRTCEDHNVYFKTTADQQLCKRMCAWNNHYCWPGTCGESFTEYCQCAPGFKKNAELYETTCQLDTLPTIETCHTEAVGPSLEKKRSGSSGPTTECRYETDFYGNYVPTHLQYDIFASFHINTAAFPQQPSYIDSFGFGITDVEISATHKSVAGYDTFLGYEPILADKSQGSDATAIYGNTGNVTLPPTLKLESGDRLCLSYGAYGGGFLISIDTYGYYQPRSAPVSYWKKMTSKTVCYLYDDKQPQHCLETGPCTSIPLALDKRVSKTPNIGVDFRGWLDPIPAAGTDIHASGIELYQITVNEVTVSNTVLKVGTSAVFTHSVDMNGHRITLDMPTGTPKLYCVSLGVKDFADNVKQARQFFLYDESSFITSRPDKNFYVSSAMEASNYLWHVPGQDVCLDWKDYFYNQFYMDNNLLLPVEPDPHGLINGIYEQTSGTLPVSGTPNVYGIIKFMFSFSKNNATFSDATEVSNFLDQTLCTTLDLYDGDTYILKILAIDIADNFYSEDRVLYIDGSAPHIENIGLEKDGYRELFVHDQTDLSKMDLQFDAYDPHSGIKTVEWFFGITDYNDPIASGTIGVNNTYPDDCLDGCYCPVVGDCEMLKYSIPLHGLIAKHKHIGNHNRNYFFTIKVTNYAMFTTTEYMDILVDDSPPETGVILEGPGGYFDIDYTSEETFLVNWHGFIDQESGIRLYRIGLASHCLTKEEVYMMESTPETIFEEVIYPDNMVQFSANFTGKRYVTGIAINNAMAPSDPVCSDGIVKDIHPPTFLNITIKNARWTESLYCFENKTMFLRSDLIGVKLADVQLCNNVCGLEKKRWPFVETLPEMVGEGAITESVLIEPLIRSELLSEKNESVISGLLCSELPVYDSTSLIYLPNDHIQLYWNVSDDLSQIAEFYIGFGESEFETAAPGLVDYQSTNKKFFFKVNHVAIGTDKEFYIFLKAVNTAGLEAIMTIGPLLIDQTPPKFNHIPEAIIDGENVVVGWNADTFYDEEQSTEIHRISFQIGHDNKAVSPFLDWRRDSVEDCHEFSNGCIKYPLSSLQSQDTDLGLKFYITLHVYNIAGHFLTVVTPEFTIPSRYPPGQAIVTDLNPAEGTENVIIDRDLTDIDAHFSANTLCAIWKGFHHPESLTLEFGIGSATGLDDIYTFTIINNTHSHCLTSTNIPFEVKIYVSVRATNSAGSTTSSSDGVVIYNISRILDQLNVFDGPECFTQTHLLPAFTILQHIGKESFIFNLALMIGKVYTLRFFSQDNAVINAFLNSSDFVILTETSSSSYQQEFVFQPYVEYPVFSISNVNLVSVTADLYDCEEDVTAAVSSKSSMAHWRGLSDHFEYEVTLIKLSCSDTANDSCFDYLLPFMSVEENTIIKHESNLSMKHTYYTGVMPCINSVCGNAKLSSGVYIEPDTLTLNIIKSELVIKNSDCTHVVLEWTPVSDIDTSFYQWSVGTTFGKSTTLSAIMQWQTVEATNNDQVSVKINECVPLPGHVFKQLYGCVRALSRAGQKTKTCNELTVASDQNAYKSTVYEFDATSVIWADIKNIIRSRYLGDQLRVLHEADLDFGTADSEVVGAVLNGNDRNITWYLTTTQVIPNTCNTYPECKASRITSDGYVAFQKDKISFNTIYFICAYAPQSQRVQDSFTETLTSIHACSNGFVVDDLPPSAGEVHPENINGYINSVEGFTVSWKSFDDNIDINLLGYKYKINSYAVEIGSTPKRQDIKQYSVDGDITSLLIDDMHLTSGMSIYISVIATDHAGLQTRVSSEKLIVDNTPPTVGRIFLKTETVSNWISDGILTIQILDFSDKESGIDKYMVHVGSSKYKMDILSQSEHADAIIQLSLQGTDVLDGHFYHLGLKAINRAGLSSAYTFIQFGVDQSAPTGGHVMDGPAQDNVIDIDFQTDLDYISGHWKGFTDPHSSISYYTVGLGTEPFTYDTEPRINVGFRTDIIWNSTFTTGEKYFITVEACNEAALCHAVSSDGIVLDDSPPIPGIVRVGSNSHHHTYISKSSSVEIFWTGFEDPQSGMNHYEACLETSPNTCNFVPMFNCLLSSSHFKSGLNMPVNTNLFVTVKGYNKNNQSVAKTSNYFIVDPTPPEILMAPKFVTDYTSSDKITVQSEKSVINLIWKFSDSESPVVRHIVTLATHHEGHTPVEHVELGKVNRLTINTDGKNWLHNGDKYKAIVTCCNAAGLCSTIESDYLLIDSTPPHVGGFKTPMTWRNFQSDGNLTASEINLTWYGFYDHESGIKRFYVGIGSTYTGNEFTNGLVEIETDGVQKDFNNSFILPDILWDEEVVVSIVAENNAGLMSSVARVTLLALYLTPKVPVENAHGVLEIEKHSCDLHFCNKDCTCAVIGKVCMEVETNLTCNDITTTSESPFSVSLRVYGGLEDNPQHITASSACLSAHWTVEEGQSEIKRFEWTLGIKDEPYGEGIFDLVYERPWMDVGNYQYAVYCLPLNRRLVHSTYYTIYVKAWVAMDTFNIFESQPLLVDQTPPAIRRGEVVKDTDDSFNTDYDIIDWTDKISACWSGVFYEAQGTIVYFIVSMGTLPGFDDIIHQTNVERNTTFAADGLSLSPGQSYYFTVIAYNSVGLHSSASSDGFIIDLDKPVSGVLYNTYRYRNYAWQSSTDIFELSWKGFLDHDSGIESYYVALVEDSENQPFVANFSHVSLQTAVKLKHLNLEHGKMYFGAVKGVDAVGHESDVVFSKSKLVDATPPMAYKCENSNLIFEMQTNETDKAMLEFPATFLPDAMYTVSGSVHENNFFPNIKFSIEQNVAKNMPLESTHDGRLQFHYAFYPNFQGTFSVVLETDSSATVFEEVSFTKCDVSPVEDDSDALTVKQISDNSFTAGIKAIDPESAIKSTYLGVGTSPNGYQLKSLYLVDVNTDIVFTVSASHGTPVYATAIVENFAGLRSVFRSKKVVTDHTAPVIQDIVVEKKVVDAEPFNASDVADGETILQLKVSWNARDVESGLKLCFVSVGSLSYSEDILKSQMAYADEEFYTSSFKAKDGDKIYVNIKCVNNIEMAAITTTEPIVIAINAPSIDEARVTFLPTSKFTTSEYEDAVQPNQSFVQFSWKGFSDNSGISNYEYRLSSMTSSLIDWTDTASKDFVSLSTLSLDNNESYLAEVRAVNLGHLGSENVSSTLLIMSQGPQLTGEQINITTNGRRLTLEWKNIFTTHPEIPVLYDVMVGTAQGYVDILDIQSLTTHTRSFHVPEDTILTEKINELFITISAVYSTGISSTYSATYKVPF